MSVLALDIIGQSRLPSVDYHENFNHSQVINNQPSPPEAASPQTTKTNDDASDPHLANTHGFGDGCKADLDRGCIVIIEPRLFLRECIRRGMQGKFAQDFEAVAGIEEFMSRRMSAPVRLIILSFAGSNELATEARRQSIERLAAFAPQVPIVLLASRHDQEMLQVALALGVKGYIPMSMGFDLAVEAARFIMAGGTFFPRSY